MIQRLDEPQIRQMIYDLMPEFLKWPTPDPISEVDVANCCGTIASSEKGRCYGLFDDSFQPLGFFVGVICKHPESGVPVGIEHEWWMAKPSSGGLALLEAFEKDCREAGCKYVISGYSQYLRPDRMAKIYEQRGYKPHSVSVIKEL